MNRHSGKSLDSKCMSLKRCLQISCQLSYKSCPSFINESTHSGKNVRLKSSWHFQFMSIVSFIRNSKGRKSDKKAAWQKTTGQILNFIQILSVKFSQAESFCRHCILQPVKWRDTSEGGQSKHQHGRISILDVVVMMKQRQTSQS